MTGQYIVQGIFALAGTVSLLASLLNWAGSSQHVMRKPLSET